MAQETPTKGSRPVLTAMQQALQEVEVVEPGGAMQTALPLIQGAFVVYMGADPKMSVALQGRVFVERTETDEPEIGLDGKPLFESEVGGDGTPLYDHEGKPRMRPVHKFFETKTPSMEGTQAYDFSAMDLMGRRIKSRFLPVGGPDVRGKPFSSCEHAEHLRRFLRRRNRDGVQEFKILAGPAGSAVFNEYVRNKERQLHTQDQHTQETVGA